MYLDVKSDLSIKTAFWLRKLVHTVHTVNLRCSKALDGWGGLRRRFE